MSAIPSSLLIASNSLFAGSSTEMWIVGVGIGFLVDVDVGVRSGGGEYTPLK